MRNTKKMPFHRYTEKETQWLIKRYDDEFKQSQLRGRYRRISLEFDEAFPKNKHGKDSIRDKFMVLNKLRGAHIHGTGTIQRATQKIPLDGNTDLAFLLESQRQSTWDDQQMIVRIVGLAQQRIPRETIAKRLGLATGRVTVVLTELKRAAKEGYTLEKYLEANRPLSLKNKVLAK